MKTLKFASTINCNGCLSKVSPLLEANTGIESWHVDLKSEERILTVETEHLSPTEIQQIVAKAGFKATEK